MSKSYPSSLSGHDNDVGQSAFLLWERFVMKILFASSLVNVRNTYLGH
jgi:hypothetical protein